MRPFDGALRPANAKAEEFVRSLDGGENVMVRVLRGRSTRQNAYYWAALERAVDATGRWRTPQELHAALRIALGYVDEVKTLAGRRVLVPRSTGFDNMSHDEAQAYYDAAFKLLAETVGIGIGELIDG